MSSTVDSLSDDFTFTILTTISNTMDVSTYLCVCVSEQEDVHVNVVGRRSL